MKSIQFNVKYGSLHIMRKVVGDKELLLVLSADIGFVFNPSKISF